MAIIPAQGMMMSGGGAALGVFWNPADKNALVVLSNNNLTATRGSAINEWKAARANVAYSTGKYYYELEVDDPLTNGVEGGFANATFNVNTGVLDSDPNAWALFSLDGQPYHNAVAIDSPIGAITAGQRMQFAIDFDAGKIWVGREGTFSGDPAAGTGERFTFTANTAMFPACALFLEFTVLTGAFRSDHFNFTPPTGYSAWDP